MTPEFVFYHIPKCGGTSLRDYLYKILELKYNRSQIYYPRLTKQYRPAYGNKNLSTIHEYQNVLDCVGVDYLNDIKAVLCHIRYDTEYLSFKKVPNIVDMLVMRDPVDRLISHYNFFDTILFDGRPIHDLSIDQLRLYCESRGNVMFQYLRGRTDTGYIGGIDDARRNIDNIKYKTTLENLNDNLEDIGNNILEDLNISCRLPALQWLQKGSVEVSRYNDLYENICEILDGFADVRLYKHLQQTLK